MAQLTLAVSKIAEALDISQDLWSRLAVRAPERPRSVSQPWPNVGLGALRISLIKCARRVCSIVEASELVEEIRVYQLDASSRDCGIPPSRRRPFGSGELKGWGQRPLA